MNCIVDGCMRTGRIKRGMCNTHYLRWLKYGDASKGGKELSMTPRGINRTCEVYGCSNKYIARGMCHAHYKLWQKHGDPLIQKKQYGEKHGMRHTPEYNSWRGMKERCLNPNNSHYKSYGGRGIKICDAWLHSFTSFYESMGNRPFNMTLDRIDNNNDYKPSNCKWSTNKEQRANKQTC